MSEELSTYRQVDLPSPIDRLFLKMATRYGKSWFDMWQGVPISEVKADWLEAIEKNKFTLRTVMKAVDAMDEKQRFPPNMIEFIGLCKVQVPKPYQQSIGKRMTEEERSENLKRLHDAARGLTVKPKFLMDETK